MVIQTPELDSDRIHILDLYAVHVQFDYYHRDNKIQRHFELEGLFISR